MIAVLFNILLLLIPLIFYKNTSELFEFNKIVTLYTFTVLIVTAWIYKSIVHRKFIFRRTILDKPLVIYLSIYLLTTLFSIDLRTSIFGYYSRFNGGLLSQICYTLLYWAFVSNMDKDKMLKSIKYILIGTFIASVLAIFEHFGIFATCAPIRYSLLHEAQNNTEISKFVGFSFYEKLKYLFLNSCWIQDVKNRVFSTLGQPNWLAALVVTLIPLTWLKIEEKKSTLLKYYLLFTTLLMTLIFTKSRSGLLAFGVTSVIFWIFVFYKNKFKYLKEFLILAFLSLILVLAVNIQQKRSAPPKANIQQGQILEVGGTESGTIRKYVWQSAINIFLNSPIVGTGPETFAFSFPMHKPVGHNLTSEWDFIYNKAHNEYLNYLATTGILGLISYLSLIIFSIIQILKISDYKLKIAFLSGYLGILITNFFGFSVVPTSLLFFLIPAFSFVVNIDKEDKFSQRLNKTKSKILALTSILIMSYLLFLIYRYWISDVNYNSARNLTRQNKIEESIAKINKSLKVSPNEAVFVSELALADGKIETAINAVNLSPFNQNIRKILINNLNKNSDNDPKNLLIAEDVVKDTISFSPNDPKLYYQLAILNIKNNKIDDSLVNLKKAIDLKQNYKEAHFAIGLTYIDTKQFESAKYHLEYILQNIDPNDELTKKYLEQAQNQLTTF